MYLPAAVAVVLANAPTDGSVPSQAPEQAAGSALMQCVAHSANLLPIVLANAGPMLKNGLVYSSEPPAFLNSTRVTPYGKAEYAHAPSAEGQVWTVGYDKGACLVFVLGTNVVPVEKRLTELFAISNSWKPEKAAEPAPGERKSQYAWAVGPDMTLTALVSYRDLPGEAKGLAIVTISEVKGK